MPRKLSYHKLANLFPLMEGVQFSELVEDIKANGLREPIVTYKGKILDGRNRYRACKEAEIDPLTQEWDGKGDIASFVISKNLHRRHLDEGRRSMIAAQLANLKRGDNQHASKEATSQKQAAALLNVSRASVQRAKEVLARGTPEDEEAVTRGEVSVSRKASEIRGRSTPTKSKTGKGVDLAHEAINCLIRIRKNDPLRKQGFRIVKDWIRFHEKQG